MYFENEEGKRVYTLKVCLFRMRTPVLSFLLMILWVLFQAVVALVRFPQCVVSWCCCVVHGLLCCCCCGDGGGMLLVRVTSHHANLGVLWVGGVHTRKRTPWVALPNPHTLVCRFPLLCHASLSAECVWR